MSRQIADEELLGFERVDRIHPVQPLLSRWKSHLSPCHPDRSAAQRRDLRFSGPFLEMFFDRGVMGLRPISEDETGADEN
jgi:hypothetical protein